MPRLYHRPPKYCLHKGTQQATISLGGQRIYLGPYGSPQSHAAYQKALQDWHQRRENHSAGKPLVKTASEVAKVTTASLREKRRAGSPRTINELVLV